MGWRLLRGHDVEDRRPPHQQGLVTHASRTSCVSTSADERKRFDLGEGRRVRLPHIHGGLGPRQGVTYP